jgi:hypothetical protein
LKRYKGKRSFGKKIFSSNTEICGSGKPIRKEKEQKN